MRVNVASLVPMVDAKGPEMDESETVTLFNDLCIFAPGALVDGNIQWQEIDRYTVSASFTKGRHTIRATLCFNERGELNDFVSDDRSAASKDGHSFTRMRWSTPLRNYRTFGPHLIMSEGEGVWHAPTGTYTYLHFDLDAIEYNLAAVPRPQRRGGRPRAGVATRCPPARPLPRSPGARAARVRAVAAAAWAARSALPTGPSST
jgi:hypothetical protein